jgi:hypothetical protein
LNSYLIIITILFITCTKIYIILFNCSPQIFRPCKRLHSYLITISFITCQKMLRIYLFAPGIFTWQHITFLLYYSSFVKILYYLFVAPAILTWQQIAFLSSYYYINYYLSKKYNITYLFSPTLQVCRTLWLSSLYKYLHILSDIVLAPPQTRVYLKLRSTSTLSGMAGARNAAMCLVLILVLFGNHGSAGLCSSLFPAVQTDDHKLINSWRIYSSSISSST